MKNLKLYLGAAASVTTLIVFLFMLDGYVAKASDLETTDIGLKLHIINGEYTELDAQVWALEWEANGRELTEKEMRQLYKKKKRLAEIEAMKKLYLEKVVK